MTSSEATLLKNSRAAFVGPCDVENQGEWSIDSFLRPRILEAFCSLYDSYSCYQGSESVWSFIEKNLSILESGREIFQPGIGVISHPHESEGGLILQFALVLVAMGAAGGFEFELKEEEIYYFGCHPLSLNYSISVNSSKGGVTISVTRPAMEDTVHRFRLIEGIWSDSNIPDGDDRFRRKHVRVLLQHDKPYFPDGKLVRAYPLSPAKSSDIKAHIDLALELIRFAKPEYLHWIGNVLRSIVFVQVLEGVVSHSDEYRPGVIVISHPTAPDKLAIQLVHECAHQYFYALEHYGLFVKGNHQQLYYSPFRTAKRPLRLVLLAIHACANILKLVEGFRLSGLQTKLLTTEWNELRQKLLPAVNAIEGSSGLTEAGYDFFEGIKSYCDLQQLRQII